MRRAYVALIALDTGIWYVGVIDQACSVKMAGYWNTLPGPVVLKLYQSCTLPLIIIH